MKPRAKAALWTCPRCGEQFSTRNVWHACGTFRLEKVVSLSPGSHQHIFRLENERQMGSEFRRLLHEAYAVGRR